MKKIFCLFLIPAFFFFTKAEAQQILINVLANDGVEIPLQKDSTATITSFWAKQMQDTVYLCWKVKDLFKDGLFIVYTSTDGKNFKIIGTKKAIGVAIHNDIAYYMKDRITGADKIYYKVICINTASKFLTSEKISVGVNKTITAGNNETTLQHD